MSSFLKNKRMLTVIVFAARFTYQMAFLFEGAVLYNTLAAHGAQAAPYVLTAVIAVFLGLFTGGYFIKTQRAARLTLITATGVSILSTLPFFFAAHTMWLSGLAVAGYSEGAAQCAWGFFVKEYTPKNGRIKAWADMIIIANVSMLVINVVTARTAYIIGLLLAVLCLAVSGAVAVRLPAEPERAAAAPPTGKPLPEVIKPMLLLFLFVTVLTIDSGFMYQIINPAFAHLTGLTIWYWAVPYIIAIIVMRNLPARANRSTFLYVGMVMIMGAFICFMLMGRGTLDYYVVDTLMLGACGIFDLFWCSILGETLDYTGNPAKTLGIGISANVLGVWIGGVIGVGVTSSGLPGAEVTVIALSVVCVTLVMLPPLNTQLRLLLKSHAYLAAYANMNEVQQSEVIQSSRLLDSLTEREQEAVQQLLAGKSIREIGAVMEIGESTVKFHLGNVYSKFGVANRAELIALLLNNREPHDRAGAAGNIIH